jgi:hypothetical protein
VRRRDHTSRSHGSSPGRLSRPGGPARPDERHQPAAPGGAAHKPGGAAHKPGGAAHKPGGAAHEPGGAAHEPGGAAHPPPSTAHRAAAVARPNRPGPAPSDRHRPGPGAWFAGHTRPSIAELGLLFVRYGIGWLLVIAGVVLAIVNPGGFGWDGFGIFAGCGLSILMLNYLYRIGVSGDEERQREEDARRYLAEHGHWPDEPPR